MTRVMRRRREASIAVVFYDARGKRLGSVDFGVRPEWATPSEKLIDEVRAECFPQARCWKVVHTIQLCAERG